MSKCATLLLIVLLTVSSLIVAKAVPASASIPKPTVPEFTVKYINPSYYVPPTTSIDPYTGQTVTQGGSYVEGDKKIEVEIINQPLTNNSMQLFYSVRVKGHFSQDWAVIDYWDKEAPVTDPYVSNPYPEQNYSSQYTVLDYHEHIPSKGQMDFQVQALIGHVDRVSDPNHSALYNMYYANAVFTGESSDWSNILTLSIPDGSTSISTSPSPTPSVPEFPSFLAPSLLLALSVIGTLLYRKRQL